MDFVGKALWYIEANFEDEFTLDDVAAVAGLSKFHLSRAFGACFGKSVIRYARERRLSEAAKRLAVNGHGILDVAIQFGYNSHEAFTRAFKAQFGVTPELDVLRIPPQTYAVFIHDGHVSDIRRTWKAIFGTWSQNTKYKLVDAPQFERYGENFDPETGNNDIEIWIPVH